MNTVTRRQIKSKGATQYLANKLTRDLSPVGKDKTSYTYAVNEVLEVVKHLIKKTRIRKSNISILNDIEQWLSSIEDNIIQFPENHATLAEQLCRTRKSVLVLKNDLTKVAR